MSSRQEEKERRKRERQEREAAEKAKAASRKRMQMVFGGALGLVAVVGVVAVLVFVVFGGDDSPSEEVPASAAAIPAQKEADPEKAAELAKCTLRAEAGQRGLGSRGEGLQGLGLQAEPADLGQPLPAVVRGRHLRGGRHAGARQARPHARARPHRHPVQAGHARDDGRAAGDALQRDGRRAPPAAVRERHGHEGRCGRHRLGRVAQLRHDEPAGLRCHPRLPHGAHRQGPRGRAVGR